MALQPVTFRPVTAVKPVARKADDQIPRKPTEKKQGARRGRALEPGQGENLDTWV